MLTNRSNCSQPLWGNLIKYENINKNNEHDNNYNHTIEYEKV